VLARPGFYERIFRRVAAPESEGVFDKLTMSAFEGTWLDFALRDCGINAFIIVGIATGIEPTARHGVDLGYIPVPVTDACGAGYEEAAKRSIESLKFAGDTILVDTKKICAVLQQRAMDRPSKTLSAPSASPSPQSIQPKRGKAHQH
jgi:nicotinamidase-related amidase